MTQKMMKKLTNNKGAMKKMMRGLDDGKFDITLLFGPMYHLHGDENKIKALSEAKRITKKDR